MTVRADRIIDLSYDDLQGIITRWVASLTDVTDTGPAVAQLSAG